MALVALGSITVDFNLPKVYYFPTFIPDRDTGYLFFLEAVPITTAPTYSYLSVIPAIRIGNTWHECPALGKWFPKGESYCFKYTSPQNQGTTRTSRIGVWPVSRYKGRPIPSQFTVKLSVDLALKEPAVRVN